MYRKRFASVAHLPAGRTGLDTDIPTEKFYLFPFYTLVDIDEKHRETLPVAFFRLLDPIVTETRRNGIISGPLSSRCVRKRNWTVISPFTLKTAAKTAETLVSCGPFTAMRRSNSDSYQLERDRVLYFLYSDATETWTNDGKSRRKVSCWPLFTYRSDERGVKSVSFPAPVEPILNKEGIEKAGPPSGGSISRNGTTLAIPQSLSSGISIGMRTGATILPMRCFPFFPTVRKSKIPTWRC